MRGMVELADVGVRGDVAVGVRGEGTRREGTGEVASTVRLERGALLARRHRVPIIWRERRDRRERSDGERVGAASVAELLYSQRSCLSSLQCYAYSPRALAPAILLLSSRVRACKSPTTGSAC